MAKPQISLIGLAVMGSNLARNIERNGFPITVYNRTTSVTDEFMNEFGNAGNFHRADTLQQLVDETTAPRQIILMIKAGKPVDSVMAQLLPLLDKGDIIIDAGNGFYRETQRREAECAEYGISFLGIGVSGGEEGALNGPSIMPGGKREAWEIVAPMLEKIAAEANGEPCTGYIGPDGAGHFVKMVHNGIEYGDMQLIAESYQVLEQLGRMKPTQLADTFAEWNRGPLQSFLIEITAEVFRQRDDLTDGYLVDAILDKAGQKGTGRWTVIEALKLGVSVPTIAAAVDARVLSSMKEVRKQASQSLSDPNSKRFTFQADCLEQLPATVHDALYCAKVLSYAQGMALLGRASGEFEWDLKLGEIAAVWRGGCIIRAAFLDQIRAAYKRELLLVNLLFDPELQGTVTNTVGSLREIVANASQAGIPVPAFSASLAYYDAFRSERLPQNLTQAQRDYFGAHTYERIDREGVFHTEWGVC